MQDSALVKQLEESRAQYTRLSEDFRNLHEQMTHHNIHSYEDLQRYNRKTAEALVNLAGETPPATMQGINVGFFGVTSTGKSTMINKLIGSDLAPTGHGETTTKITRYNGSGYILWDTPGRNDHIPYFSMEYVAFWKGLTARVVLLTTTVKEMTNVFQLLDAISLNYDIVVNKFDIVPREEQESLKAKIEDEIAQCGLKGANKVWFVSSRYPHLFPDWLDMADYLTVQNSFEDMQRHDGKTAEALMKLATESPPATMQGINVGFFGVTSTGKSTMINKILERNLAPTGPRETTKEFMRYDGIGYRLWDTPGRNDHISYFSMEYVAFWKGLTARVVLLTTTVKEMTNVFQLLDAISLNYDIVVNKFDTVNWEEREAFKAQIKQEIIKCGLKGAKNVWFVSSRNPGQFPDWMAMMDYLTEL